MRRNRQNGRWTWHFGLGGEVGSVFWGMVFVEAAFGGYMGIWPLWIEALGAPVTVVGLVIGSSGLLRLAALAPSAILAERFGARRLIVAARVAAGLGMVGAAIATHWTHLFMMVIGSAIGELAFPLAQSHVVAHAGRDRVRAFTLVFTVGPAIAFGLGPLVAGALVSIWGMRAAFIFAALCTAASVAAFSRIERGSRRKSGATETAASTYPEALADPGVRRVLALQVSTIFALALGTTLVPTFLKDERGMDPARVATLGGAAAVGTVLFGLTVARTRRLQAAPFVAIAFAVAFVATGLVAFVRSDAIALIVLAFVLRGGFFSAWALFAAALAVLAPERHRARAFATSEMLGGFAFSLAPVIAGQLYAVRPSLPLVVAATLACALVPLLIRAHVISRRATPVVAPAPEFEPEIA